MPTSLNEFEFAFRGAPLVLTAAPAQLADAAPSLGRPEHAN
jgi:hypothetical protein